MLVKAERSQHYVLLRAFQSQVFVQETAGQKGAIPCQNRQKDENGTFNTLFNFKFSFKKQPPKRPQYFC
jgi:hypothetical protein